MELRTRGVDHQELERKRLKMEGYKRDLLLEPQLRLHLSTLHFLLRIGCCPRCAFRFVNMRNALLYNEDPELLMEVACDVDPQVTTRTPPTQVCVACLGVLQLVGSQPQFLQRFFAAWRDSGFQVQDYALTVQLPVSLYVRNHSIWHHLRDTFQPKKEESPAAAAAVGGGGGTTAATSTSSCATATATASSSASFSSSVPATTASSSSSSTTTSPLSSSKQHASRKHHHSAAAHPAVVTNPNLFKEQSPSDSCVDVKDCVKWILSEQIKRTLGYEFKFMSDFKVLLTFQHPLAFAEAEFLLHVEGSLLHSKKKKIVAAAAAGNPSAPEISVPILCRTLELVTPAQFMRHGQCPPQPVDSAVSFLVSFERAPLFVAGRYFKIGRDLSQTSWVIDGQRMSDSSVEELLCPALQRRFRADTAVFHSAGREDVDVRMLGGRPFVVELLNPRLPDLSESEFQDLQAEINRSTHRMQVRDLQKVTKADCVTLKEGEETKKKTYRCVVWLSRAIAPADLDFLRSVRDLQIQQKTPVRVLHRRSLAVRPKLIHSISYEYLNEHFVQLDLVTQAGTYIKEFVHGDLGRTQPNFGELMRCEADILQLDVLKVDLDFPPATSNP